MRCAIHVEALSRLITGAVDPSLFNFFAPAIIGVTEEILKEYDAALSKNPSFTAWFTHYQSSGRIISISSGWRAQYAFPTLVSINSDYLPAAFLTGLELYTSSTTGISTQDAATLKKWGIESIPIEHCQSILATGYYGDNPFKEINLKENGNIPHCVFTRYCSNEKKLTVYDRYIDSEALALIIACCKVLAKDAIVNILTSKNAKKTPTEIQSALKKALPNGTIKCGHASTETILAQHDRFIFIGNRFQALFTRGLDVFGQSNSRAVLKNRAGSILIYDVQLESTYGFYYEDGYSVTVRMR